jgi:hypothetical protein
MAKTGILGKSLFYLNFRCILAELFNKKPIFQGQDEYKQLEIISSFCGSITSDGIF